jgi:uncharacterized repeat protein (TIGR03847 family)
MTGKLIEINPVDFVTIGTIGPKGQRVFHLQSGRGNQLITLLIEKEQAWALSEAIREMLEDLQKRRPDPDSTVELDFSGVDMDLREPIEPVFRVSQMGLGYDEERDMIVLVAQEMVSRIEDPDDPDEPEEEEPSVARLWCSRMQMRLLSAHTLEVVKAGRADPKQNGRLTYYWT